MKRDKRRVVEKAAAAPAWKFDRRHWLLGIVILIALLAYANSFHAPFVMDNAELLNDTRLRDASSENIARIWNGSYHQSVITNLYRPLTSMSYLYNYAVRGDGANPWGYHAFNFFVHAVNIGLVYLLGLILFESIPAALALSALWGVHPVLTEAVTNIVGRADALAACGVLGAVVGYHYSLRAAGKWRWTLVGATALATTIGVFSKEAGVVALAAVILYDLVYARGTAWRLRLPGLAAVAIPAAVFLAVRAKVMAGLPLGPFPFTDNPITGAGFVEGRITAFRVIGKYVGLLVWPRTLAADYSYNEIPVRVDWKGIAALVLCVAAAGVAVWGWRRARALSFAILFFFVALAPVANIFLVIGTIMGERFLYLPAVGFTAVVVYGLNRLWLAAPQRRKAIAAAVGVLVVALAGRAAVRNDDWADEQRFWNTAVAAAPGSFKPHVSLASVLPRNSLEDWQHALVEAQRGLTILDPLPNDRNNSYSYRTAGTLFRGYADELEKKGDKMGAYQWRQQSVRALMRSENIEAKLDEATRAINTKRGVAATTYLPAAVYRELGITYLRLNDLPHAVQALTMGHGLESEPDLLENLAVAYGLSGNLRGAAQAIVEEMLMDSSRTYLSGKVIPIYKQLDPAGCAEKAGVLDPTCPMVHEDICLASKNVIRNYRQRNQSSEAASIERVAMTDLGCTAASLK